MRNEIEFKAKIVRLVIHNRLLLSENRWLFNFLSNLPSQEYKIIINILYKILNDNDKNHWLKCLTKMNVKGRLTSRPAPNFI